MSCRALLVGLTSFCIGSTVMADETKGSIVLVGKGVASSAPEFVSLSIKVSSICYQTSQDAQAANAKLANHIVEILKNFKNDDRDQITASGGANLRQTETTQIGSESKVLCEMKWRSENLLEIAMAKIADLPELQDKIFSELNQSADINPDQAEQTFAEVGRPNFGLYPETSVKLRNQAQVLAFDDAKSQFDSLNGRCAFVDPKLVSIMPPEFNYAMKSAGREAASYSSPVIPDTMEVHATLKMEWEFIPDSACKH